MNRPASAKRLPIDTRAKTGQGARQWFAVCLVRRCEFREQHWTHNGAAMGRGPTQPNCTRPAIREAAPV